MSKLDSKPKKSPPRGTSAQDKIENVGAKPEHHSVAVQQVPLARIKANPSNPRVLRDEKFAKLKKSIQDFPDMLNYRSIVAVTDTDGRLMVLGGNMRLRAMQDLGIKTAPVMLADHWTKKQRERFIIADNVGFGEHDWEMLANEWDAVELADWGLDAPYIGHEVNVMDENELDLSEEFDPIGTSKGLQRVVFVFDSQEHATSFLAKDKSWKVEKFNNGWRVNLSSQSM